MFVMRWTQTPATAHQWPLPLVPVLSPLVCIYEEKMQKMQTKKLCHLPLVDTDDVAPACPLPQKRPVGGGREGKWQMLTAGAQTSSYQGRRQAQKMENSHWLCMVDSENKNLLACRYSAVMTKNVGHGHCAAQICQDRQNTSRGQICSDEGQRDDESAKMKSSYPSCTSTPTPHHVRPAWLERSNAAITYSYSQK